MPAYVDYFNQFAAGGIIVLQISFGILLIALLFFRSPTNPILVFFKRYTHIIGFIVAFGSVVMSLIYSDVIGFPPCELCLIQRAFIYPQALLYLYLLFRPLTRRTRRIIETSAIFASFGTLVSIYHVYVENGGSSNLSCVVGGPGVVPCTTIYVDQWGITIPIMALTASACLLILALNYFYMSRKNR